MPWGGAMGDDDSRDRWRSTVTMTVTMIFRPGRHARISMPFRAGDHFIGVDTQVVPMMPCFIQKSSGSCQYGGLEAASKSLRVAELMAMADWATRVFRVYFDPNLQPLKFTIFQVVTAQRRGLRLSNCTGFHLKFSRSTGKFQ